MDTETLIGRLAADDPATPRLRSPWLRAAFWLALAFPPLVLVLLLHQPVLEAEILAADPLLPIEQAAALLTAVTAAFAAFSSTIPGWDRRWLWLPALPLTAWLLTVGKGCLDDWLSLGDYALVLRVDSGCFLPMVLMGIVPSIAMVAMLRRGAPLTPRLTLVLGALAVAAVVNFGLRLFHVGDISLMVLVWHFGVVAVLSAIAGTLAPHLFAWRLPAIS
jgi:hypothetical protein